MPVWPGTQTKTPCLKADLKAVPGFLSEWGGHISCYCEWEFSDCKYNRISGLRFLSESSKNGVEMHLECDFSPSRIQNFNPVPPVY